MAEVLRFVKDPKNAAAPIDELPGRVLMWVATCARERLVGDAIRTAMRPHGVEVVVHDLAVHTGGAVAMAFRDMVAKQQGERGPRSCYIGGIGVGGLATATAPLSTKADGLAGRIVVASPLGKKALAKLDPDHRDVESYRATVHNERAPGVGRSAREEKTERQHTKGKWAEITM